MEDEIDRLLRMSPDIAKLNPPKEPLAFGWIQDRIYKDGAYFPPLFLTATNLTTRRLEIISSINRDHAQISIAKAVRASAGFPCIFRPVLLPLSPDASWFVDGGVISNFPAWVFAREYRRQAQEATHDGQKLFQAVFSRPLIHIGLRIVDDKLHPIPNLEDPNQFVSSLFGLLTGQARNQLEAILSSFVTRSLPVEQLVSETDGPRHFFAVEEITDAKVSQMYTRGQEFAEGCIKKLSFGLPSADEKPGINAMLEVVLSKACRLFAKNDNSNLKFRANVFVPYGKELILRYQANMVGDPDIDIRFELNGGLVGLCYQSRAPHLCNLEPIAKMAPKDIREQFNMTVDQQNKVKKDRTFLVSVPIFDPIELLPLKGWAVDDSAKAHYRYAQLPALLDGPVIGVLGLDAGFSYDEVKLDPDPIQQWSDPRVQGLLDVLMRAAFEIGEVLSRAYGAYTHD